MAGIDFTGGSVILLLEIVDYRRKIHDPRVMRR
jgi:hypothetical protein